jgi:hypothetical protein
MLYNQEWDFYSLVGLRNWLARQPEDREYYWSHCDTCVIGKYLAENGHDWGEYRKWVERANAAVAAYACFSNVRTFGRALANLDKWIAGSYPAKRPPGQENADGGQSTAVPQA